MVFPSLNNKVTAVRPAGDEFFNPGREVSLSVLFHGLKDSLNKKPLHPAVKGGVAVLMGTPQDMEFAAVFGGNPRFFQGGI